MINNKNILISGAGISGLTLAHWLQHWGFPPTVIEKRANLDQRGYMIDFYGSGFDVAEKMNLLKELQTKSSQYSIKKLTFVDGHGRPRATLDVEKFRDLLHRRYFPLMRGDLETVLYESVRAHVPVRFGMSAAELHRANGEYQTAFPAYQELLQPEIERRQKAARGLAGSFVSRNNFEIAISHFFLNAAFWPIFRSLFAKQVGAKSFIK